MIRGIDSQIMIQRSVDYARRAGEQIGNIEQGKDFVAMLEKERAVHKTQSIEQAEHAEHRRINPDEEEEKDRGGRQQKDRNSKNKEKLGGEIDINV